MDGDLAVTSLDDDQGGGDAVLAPGDATDVAPGDAAEPADAPLLACDAAAESPADDVDAGGENVLEQAHLEGVLESLLLAAGAPVPLARLVDALGGPGRAEVARALRGLAERFERDARGVRLVQVAGGYQLRSAPQHGPFVRRLLGGKPPRLSRPMLETLAIIAYRQPCTRPEIEAVRGVDCGAAVNSLLERRLVRIEGRKEAPGRPLLYGTTKDFLEVFGLPDLQALPPLRELGDGAGLLLEADLTVAAGGVHATRASALRSTEDAPPAPEGAPDAEAASPTGASASGEASTTNATGTDGPVPASDASPAVSPDTSEPAPASPDASGDAALRLDPDAGSAGSEGEDGEAVADDGRGSAVASFEVDADATPPAGDPPIGHVGVAAAGGRRT